LIQVDDEYAEGAVTGTQTDDEDTEDVELLVEDSIG
jgi:hypothetical protein